MAVTAQALRSLQKLDPSAYAGYMGTHQGMPESYWDSGQADVDFNRTIQGSAPSFAADTRAGSQWPGYFNVLGIRGIENLRGPVGFDPMEEQEYGTGLGQPKSGPFTMPPSSIAGLQAAQPQQLRKPAQLQTGAFAGPSNNNVAT